MLKKLPIRWRLTGWYFLSAAVIGLFFGLGSWYEMRASLLDAIDTDLEHRIRNFSGALVEHPAQNLDEIRRILDHEATGVAGGADYEAFTADGQLLYQGSGLARLHVPVIAPPLGAGLVKRTIDSGAVPVRFVSRMVVVGQYRVILEQGEPLTVQYTSLRSLGKSIMVSVLLILILGTLSSYWISRRALDPVFTIIKEVQRINVQNVTERLTLPEANDELRLLSETLNTLLERIENSMAQIRQFTADASHELRSPLTLIRTAAEHSLLRNRSHEELMEAMQRIQRETLHTTDLINDLLLLARTDSCRTRNSEQPQDLVELVQDTVQRMLPLSLAREQELSYQSTPQPIIVMGNPDLLERLVLILVDNAVKYTPDRGVIVVSTECEATMACLRVCDNGEGVAEEDLPHIFDRFWRADKVRLRKHGGSGLGLAIAQRIVEQHQGRIVARSKVAQGMEISVYLPCFPG